MAKKSFLQSLGFGKKQRGRPRIQERVTTQYPTSLGKKTRQIKPATRTKRQKKLILANVEGAGVGFVLGTALGGFGGMVVGVPAGIFAGNVIGKVRAGKPRGRKLTFKKKGMLNSLLSTRQERVEYNRMMLKNRKVKRQ